MIQRLRNSRKWGWLAPLALVIQLWLSAVHHHDHELELSADAAHASCAVSADGDCHSDHDRDHDGHHDDSHDCLICRTIAAAAAFILPVLLLLIAMLAPVCVCACGSDRSFRFGYFYRPFGPRGPPAPVLT